MLSGSSPPVRCLKCKGIICGDGYGGGIQSHGMQVSFFIIFSCQFEFFIGFKFLMSNFLGKLVDFFCRMLKLNGHSVNMLITVKASLSTVPNEQGSIKEYLNVIGWILVERQFHKGACLSMWTTFVHFCQLSQREQRDISFRNKICFFEKCIYGFFPFSFIHAKMESNLIFYIIVLLYISYESVL